MRISCACIFILLCFYAQAQYDKEEAVIIQTEWGTTINLKSFGRSTIYLTDGSIKKHCVVTAISSESIVYLKGKVLHDLLTDKIKRIESEESNMTMTFTAEKKPMIRYSTHNNND